MKDKAHDTSFATARNSGWGSNNGGALRSRMLYLKDLALKIVLLNELKKHDSRFFLPDLLIIGILTYCLLKSSLFLLFYLASWNLLPLTQFTLTYNPIPYEIYLRLMALALFIYTIKLLTLFPKQFRFRLWIFQHLEVEFLQQTVIKIYGQRVVCLEIIFFLTLAAFLLWLPVGGIYMIWASIVLSEIYLAVAVRRPIPVLATPTWRQVLVDIKTQEINSIAKQTLYENDETLISHDVAYGDIVLENSIPETTFDFDETEGIFYRVEDAGVTADEFEESFLDSNFIPPSFRDYLEETEMKESTFFWLYFWFRALPLLGITNLILCFLIVSFGIPEHWVSSFNTELAESVFLLDEYQYRVDYIIQKVWDIDWYWYLGGTFFSSGLFNLTKKYYGIRSSNFTDMPNNSQYSRYIYYWRMQQSRASFFMDRVLSGYTALQQIKAFFLNSRATPQSLRETFLYRYYLYDDIRQLGKFFEILNPHKNKTLGFKEKKQIITWLQKKSQDWVADYYYASPAINVYPDRYYSWLDLFRMKFVLEELTDAPSVFQKLYWLFTHDFKADKESNTYFLEDLFFNTYNVDTFEQIEDVFEADSNTLEHSIKTYNMFSRRAQFYQNVDTFQEGLEGRAKSNQIMEEILASVLSGRRRQKRKYRKALRGFLKRRYKYLRYSGAVFQPTNASNFLAQEYTNVLESYRYSRLLKQYGASAEYNLSSASALFLYDTSEAYKKKFLAFDTGGGRVMTDYIHRYLLIPLIKIFWRRGDLINIPSKPEKLPIEYELLGKMLVWIFPNISWPKPFHLFSAKDTRRYQKLLGNYRWKYRATRVPDQDRLLFENVQDDDDEIFFEDFYLTRPWNKYRPYDYRNLEKEALHGFLHQANMDILPELIYENNSNQIQNVGLLHYLNRYDVTKVINNRRDFVFNDLAQLYGYAGSFFTTLQSDNYRRATKYRTGLQLTEELAYFNYQTGLPTDTFFFPEPYFSSESNDAKTLGFYYTAANLFPIGNIMPIWDREDVELLRSGKSFRLFQSLSFIDRFFYKLFRVDYYESQRHQRQLLDNLGTRQDRENVIKDMIWYKYYYKVDAILNYYDFMPSYRKFYMETWPAEYTYFPYTDSPVIVSSDAIQLAADLFVT